MAGKTLKTWIAATRPWSFTASAMSALTMLAYLAWSEGSIDLLSSLWAIGTIILFQAAGNTWSDWLDYRRGVDAADTHGADSITSGRFSPEAIRNLSLGLYAAACTAGIGLLLYTGLPLLWVGLVGLLGALYYPPLKYHALGDVVILLLYSVLPAWGISCVATGSYHSTTLWVALPVGLLVDAILHANNTRDMHTDRRAQVTTLAHVLGVQGSVIFYMFATLTPFICVLITSAIGILPLCSMLTMLLLPAALRNCEAMSNFHDETNATGISTLDLRSARLHLCFCAALSLTLLLDLWLQ